MAEDKITPEEKLLKLIENPLSAKQKPHPAFKVRPLNIRAVGSWVGGLHINKDALRPFDLRTLNKILVALCVLITLFLIFDFIGYNAKLENRLFELNSQAAVIDGGKENTAELKIDLSQTLSEMKRRNMFTFLPPKEASVVKTTNYSELVNNLKLVGIIWSDKPQAMIESVSEKKTYLLGNGEHIGELTIKSVLKDKVILSKDSQEWDLR